MLLTKKNANKMFQNKILIVFIHNFSILVGDNLAISRQYLEVVWTIALYLSAELYPIIPERYLFTVKKCSIDLSVFW